MPLRASGFNRSGGPCPHRPRGDCTLRGVDVLVNNAAWARFKATLEQARRYTQMAFEINYFAPLELSRQAIESMVARGGGWILNISSSTVLHPDPAPCEPKNRSYLFHQHMSPTLYGSTKAALERTSAGMAAELAPVNIAVNTLAPVEAVASVGEIKSGAIDSGAHMEPEEAMAEAGFAVVFGALRRSCLAAVC